jgi:hypothetical protein
MHGMTTEELRDALADARSEARFFKEQMNAARAERDRFALAERDTICSYIQETANRAETAEEKGFPWSARLTLRNVATQIFNGAHLITVTLQDDETREERLQSLDRAITQAATEAFLAAPTISERVAARRLPIVPCYPNPNATSVATLFEETRQDTLHDGEEGGATEEPEVNGSSMSISDKPSGIEG